MTSSLVSDVLRVSFQHKGAELCSVKDLAGTEYIWQAKPEIWPRHAPVLFPIVGKLRDNRYTYEGHDYSLSQHGFARDCEFTLVEHAATQCIFELNSDLASKTNYPFDFNLRIAYSLQGNQLRTSYEISNRGQTTLPFSIGAHPGFNCPLTKDERFEDYYLQLEASRFEVRALSEGLRAADTKQLNLKDGRLALNTQLFEQDALVFENSQIQNIQLCSTKSTRKITLSCENWPYFGIWTKKGCREFICLEPWYGIADVANSDHNLLSKEGILHLAAGKSFACAFDLRFE